MCHVGILAGDAVLRDQEREMLGRFSSDVRLLVGFAILRENGALIEYIVRSTAALGNSTSLTPETPTSKEERALGVSSTRWGEHSVYAAADLGLVSDPPID
ncbi:unnamed protein product [Clonostachys rosea f. rosea IK726]|uniref:Uncharacterized protein n=1 Tax=Clonostachys rosea f. rosea IK726 TaxID=1349383 RepID=A0ACA9UEG1_BIOOC|nr:unnamed protein product [Clonostachys rosea f. rosea IK726]